MVFKTEFHNEMVKREIERNVRFNDLILYAVYLYVVY